MLISGKEATTFTVANGNTSVGFPLRPGSFGNKLVALGHAFEFYKFEALSIDVSPVARFETTVPASTNAASWVLGYYPDTTTATLTSQLWGTVSALTHSTQGTASVVNVNSADESATNTGKLLLPGDTVSRRLRLNLRAIPHESRMYRTNGTATTEDPAYTQGQLIFAVTDAAGANLVKANALVSYRLRFFNPVDSTTLTEPRGPGFVSPGEFPEENKLGEVVERAAEYYFVPGKLTTDGTLAPVREVSAVRSGVVAGLTGPRIATPLQLRH